MTTRELDGYALEALRLARNMRLPIDSVVIESEGRRAWRSIGTGAVLDIHLDALEYDALDRHELYRFLVVHILTAWNPLAVGM